jgi:hypothetical protein
VKILTALLASTLAFGCNKNEAAKDAPAPATTQSGVAAVAGDSPAKGTQASRTSSPLSSPAVAALPADTRLVITARAPNELLKLLDYAGLRTRLSALHTDITEDMVRELGHDLTDPAVLSRIYGLDLDRPVGFYVQRFHDLRFGLFAHLKDEKTFEQGFAGLLAKSKGDAKKLQREVRDGASVWIDPRGEIAFIVRDGVLHILGQDRRRGALLHGMVHQLLKVAPNNTLGQAEDFKAGLSDITVGRDVAGYINVAQLISSIVGEITGAARVQRQRDEVQGLEVSGADAEALQSARERLQRMEQGALERMAQGAMVTMAVSTFAGGLSALVGGAEFSERSLEFEFGLRTTEAALPQRLLNPGKGPVGAFSALKTPPIYGGSMHLDLPGILGLVRQAATLAGGGSDLERGLSEFRKETGLDLEADVLPALTGGAELVATVDFDLENLPARANQAERRTGGALIVKLADAKKAEAMLTKIAAHPELTKLVVKEATGWRVLSGRDWRDVYVKIEGDRLVISPDATFVGRLGSAGFAAGLEPASLAARAGAVDRSGVHLVDWPRTVAISLGFDRARSARWAKEVSQPRADTQLTPEQQAALKVINDEETATNNTREAADATSADRMIAQFGPVGAELGLAGGKRVSLRVTQALKASPAKALAVVAGELAAIEQRSHTRWKDSDGFRTRRDAVRGAPSTFDK